MKICHIHKNDLTETILKYAETHQLSGTEILNGCANVAGFVLGAVHCDDGRTAAIAVFQSKVYRAMEFADGVEEICHTADWL